MQDRSHDTRIIVPEVQKITALFALFFIRPTEWYNTIKIVKFRSWPEMSDHWEPWLVKNCSPQLQIARQIRPLMKYINCIDVAEQWTSEFTSRIIQEKF